MVMPLIEHARARAQRTQTNPLATILRGVLSSLPTAILTVAAITNLQETRFNR